MHGKYTVAEICTLASISQNKRPLRTTIRVTDQVCRIGPSLNREIDEFLFVSRGRGGRRTIKWYISTSATLLRNDWYKKLTLACAGVFLFYCVFRAKFGNGRTKVTLSALLTLATATTLDTWGLWLYSTVVSAVHTGHGEVAWICVANVSRDFGCCLRGRESECIYVAHLSLPSPYCTRLSFLWPPLITSAIPGNRKLMPWLTLATRITTLVRKTKNTILEKVKWIAAHYHLLRGWINFHRGCFRGRVLLYSNFPWAGRSLALT